MVPVSVVIPCFCCAATIGRALDSVLRQSRPPAEIILVDDGSNDGSAPAISKLHGLSKTIRLERNLGPASARNAGWNAATQDYVAFLDADDAWHPRKLELQLEWMRAHPDAVMTGHAYVLGGIKSEVTSIGRATRVTARMLFLSNRFTTPSVMLRRTLPQRFRDGKRYSEDYLLWLEIVLSGAQAYYLDAPLAVLFKPAYGAGGLSAELWKMQAGELDTLARLRRLRLLGLTAYLAASAWSCLKFGRRLLRGAWQARA